MTDTKTDTMYISRCRFLILKSNTLENGNEKFSERKGKADTTLTPSAVSVNHDRDRVRSRNNAIVTGALIKGTDSSVAHLNLNLTVIPMFIFSIDIDFIRIQNISE